MHRQLPFSDKASYENLRRRIVSEKHAAYRKALNHDRLHSNELEMYSLSLPPN